MGVLVVLVVVVMVVVMAVVGVVVVYPFAERQANAVYKHCGSWSLYVGKQTSD